MDAAEYLPFDPKEVGILEMVHLPTLKAIIDGLGEDVEEEQLKQVIADNVQHLVPKHITDDDMVASISYLLVFMGFSSNYDNAITGIILITIVVVDALMQRRATVRNRHARLAARTMPAEEAKEAAK